MCLNKNVFPESNQNVRKNNFFLQKLSRERGDFKIQTQSITPIRLCKGPLAQIKTDVRVNGFFRGT